ncbi:class I SAM-dependent methyltransferase [Rhodoferax sp.]|uniref:class I SAM-dependent methyltransferase n=1 Tax=Rhodoferax sp. TaxID=50421 RepID=UPI0025D5DB79|nr:class I SAM-dependent methyltransferase [Rhodoferax sp.]
MQSLSSIHPVISFRNSKHEAVRGTLVSHQRGSLVMEVYNPDALVQISEMLHDLTVRSAQQTVYQGKAVVVSLVNTGLMVVVSVNLMDQWNEVGLMQPGSAAVGQAASAFVQDWGSRFNVRREYQVVVSEMRAYFSEVSRWVDQLDVAGSLPRDADGRIQPEVFVELGTPLLHKGREYLLWFDREAALVPEDLVPMHRSFAQTAIHPLILRAPFVHRTFSKPMGYAGDYEMVNQIVGDPRQGPTSYFQLVNFMFLQAGVAQAHRNRIDILLERLEKLAAQAVQLGRPMRVLNIGCGPALEIQRLVQKNPHFDSLEFVLVDFSEETLDYTRKLLEGLQQGTGRTLRLTMQHASVNQLLKRATLTQPLADADRFDYVYCAGLFDYLTDKVCNRLIKYMASQSRVGGKLLITNVHSSNPERRWMEHFLEWHLVYRDEAGVQKILPPGLRDTQVYTDVTGVNVFVESTVGELGT